MLILVPDCTILPAARGPANVSPRWMMVCSCFHNRPPNTVHAVIGQYSWSKRQKSIKVEERDDMAGERLDSISSSHMPAVGTCAVCRVSLPLGMPWGQRFVQRQPPLIRTKSFVAGVGSVQEKATLAVSTIAGPSHTLGCKYTSSSHPGRRGQQRVNIDHSEKSSNELFRPAFWEKQHRKAAKRRAAAGSPVRFAI